MKVRSRSANIIFKFTQKDLHTKINFKFKFGSQSPSILIGLVAAPLAPPGSYLLWKALASGRKACGGCEGKGRVTTGRALPYLSSIA